MGTWTESQLPRGHRSCHVTSGLRGGGAPPQQGSPPPSRPRPRESSLVAPAEEEQCRVMRLCAATGLVLDGHLF